MHWLPKKPHEEFNSIKYKFFEATEAEETEEFSLLGDADVYAPQFNQRVPGISLSKRRHITAADKKKVDKASISLPVPRTFKLFTFNTRPFILESCISIKEFRKRYPPEVLFDIILGARQTPPHSTPAVLQRTSLSGTTLHSVACPRRFTAIPDLQPDVSQDLQQPEITDDSASLVTLEPHLYNLDPDLLTRVYGWLDHVDIPFALSFPNFHSRVISSEDIWKLIERDARQKKSPLRQIPNQNVD